MKIKYIIKDNNFIIWIIIHLSVNFIFPISTRPKINYEGFEYNQIEYFLVLTLSFTDYFLCQALIKSVNSLIKIKNGGK